MNAIIALQFNFLLMVCSILNLIDITNFVFVLYLSKEM